MTKSLLILLLIAVSLVTNLAAQRRPVLSELKLETQLPAEIPQRVTGMAFDGKSIWLSIYYFKGSYATFDPTSRKWATGSNGNREFLADRRFFGSGTLGAIAFDGKTLWAGGTQGDTFGSVDSSTWKIDKIFSGKRRPDLQNSQSYSSFAHDGKNLWAAWQMTEYSHPAAESQQLLKIDPASGVVLASFPLPEGSRRDATHGLTFDGESLLHIKDGKLSSIDLDGHVLSQFEIPNIPRPSGLAWDGRLLWIVSFEGKLWSVPLR